ncbi:Fc.00g029720.m01.CDS01 [Cosmosporella sp. VM-42]
MDLTPPSLHTSPAPPQQNFFKSPPSPPETCCPSEGSTTNYSSPALLSRTYNIPSSYNSIESCSLSSAFPEEETTLRSLGAMSNNAWVTPDDMVSASPSASSSSTVPNILSAEYDPFASYDPCLSTSFPSQESYPPPPQNHSSLQQSSPSSTNAPTQTPLIATRGSFGHVHNPSGSRIKAEGSAPYPPVFGGPQYQSSSTMNAGYGSEGSSFPTNIQYFTGSQTPAWPRQECDTSQFYGQPQAQVSDLGQDRRPLKVTRARRPPRKHTTKEEANFQCEVKGCGKFFSRSYNYKSHLETHDEKREYPFPCPVDGCAKKFVRKTDLQRHHQSVHMKERNHKCDYCGRLFARKDTLRRHMEDGCSKRFDIGTLDLRGESYGGVDNVSRSGQPDFNLIPQPTTTLPPIIMDTVPSNSRGRGFDTNNLNPANGNRWEG